MIYYFSGTGNSFAAAKTLAQGLGEPLADIAIAVAEQNYTCTLKKGEKLGIVFPVYLSMPPKIVTDFIKKLKVTFPDEPYIFAVATCGGSAGKSIDILETALEHNGLSLDSGFSLVMPDNCIPYFEPDSPEVQENKLKKAEETLHLILRAIRLERRDFFRVKRGKYSNIVPKAVNSLLCGFVMKTKPFYVTEDCISCGLCEKICNSGCITMAAGRPVWMEEHCSLCLACLNRCPKAAIQYGKKTKKRQRYVHSCYQNNNEGRIRP
ncbi:MAG: EFR1 family ferrodoxin [Anaerotignum sp.]|nr:EFR1 family ferrodoxin [Anaerotignum sp.]